MDKYPSFEAGTAEGGAYFTYPGTEFPPTGQLSPSQIPPYSEWQKVLLTMAGSLYDINEKIDNLQTELKSYIALNTPSFTVLNALGSRKLSLRRPITIATTLKESKYLAELNDLNIWAEGESETEAHRNLIKEIELFYGDLDRNKGKLGLEMKRLWVVFNELFKPK